jgi:hypothetical protein
MRFLYRMVPEVYQLFWAAMARGEFITTPLSRVAPIASRARVVEKWVGVVGTPTLIVVTGPASSGKTTRWL